MKIFDTKFDGLHIIEPNVHNDSRGYFFESYKEEVFKNKIGNINFIQENESFSKKGTLRGLHFQCPPFDQSKLVRCISGKVLDVVVDLRKKSKTYGNTKSIVLSGQNKLQFFIPKGFAHAFVVLSDEAIFSYKVDNIYSPGHDSGIIWNDPDLNIDWIINKKNLIISKKDLSLKSFKLINSPF